MRVAVAGVGGAVGRAVVPVLVSAGHEVVGLARTAETAEWLTGLGAQVHRGSVRDHDGLVAMLQDADAVCSFAPRMPEGLAALRPAAWRVNDALRSDGVRRLVEATRDAHVRRVVHESASCLYADQGDAWIREDAPVAITAATEPTSVGESHVQDFTCGSRTGVVLRFGAVVSEQTPALWWPRAAPGWAHVVHTDDLGPAVLAALTVPSGVYNVGAQPVRRGDLEAGLDPAAVRGGLAAPVLRRLGSSRLEPLRRSLRVCSEHFTAQSGWSPRRPVFDASWLASSLPERALR